MADSQSQATAPQAWSVRMADSILQQHPILGGKWDYDWGVTLKGIESVALKTGAQKYADYIKTNLDHFVQPDGAIRGYTLEEYNLDRINTGKLLFRLYAQTGDGRYKQALVLLRRQLATQPRTGEGGFWHKQIYPYQMWLDGLYMASPFYAEFGQTFGEPAAFDDVARQIILMEKHARDPQTGLAVSRLGREQATTWADPETGCSPHFWGRAMGWYAMAMVDVLDYFPAEHPRRPDLVAIFQSHGGCACQGSGSGHRPVVPDTRPGRRARAITWKRPARACLSIRLPKPSGRKTLTRRTWPRRAKAIRARWSILCVWISRGAHLDRICRVAGLGGSPYRDGTYDYYVGEPIVSDDNKGVGPFILAAVEMGNG